MDKIIEFIKKLYRVDYLAHILFGICATELLFTIIHITRGNFVAYLIATLCIVAIIFDKEFIYDKWLKKGTFEWLDIIVGCSSVLLVIIQWLLLLI